MVSSLILDPQLVKASASMNNNTLNYANNGSASIARNSFLDNRNDQKRKFNHVALPAEVAGLA